MPRRSPRSRQQRGSPRRLPAKGRARATPRSRRPQGRSTRSAIATPRVRSRAGAPARADAHARRGKAPAMPRAVRRRGRFVPPDPDRVRAILDILERTYPDARTALDFGTPLQLLIATILSAQCTDARVNQVTPALFRRYPDAATFAAADPTELEDMIRSTGFYRNKAKAIRACCADIVNLYGGEVPNTLEALTGLHGVGRKTANVVLGNAFGIPGIVVDTHVSRLAHRLGLTRETDPVKIEFALMPIIPRERWTLFSHWLILHGRAICVARKPRCSICPLLPHCPRLGVTLSA